jgi:glyoxylase I family protein
MAIEVRGLAPLLQVFDMPASITFYRDVLGFRIVGSDGKTVPNNDWVLLELDGTQLMLNTAYEADSRPQSPDRVRIASHDDTCIYFGCPDVDAAYLYLREKGIELKPPKVAPYGMKQLYLHDPDGFGLCFQWRAEKTVIKDAEI